MEFLATNENNGIIIIICIGSALMSHYTINIAPLTHIRFGSIYYSLGQQSFQPLKPDI
jgi:hypothetical protein